MSLLDFNTYKPNYIGKPVEAIGNYFKEAGQQRNRIVDSASALDIALSNLDIDAGDVGAQQLKDEQYGRFKSGVQQVIDTDSPTVGNAIIKKLSKDFVTNAGLKQAVENKQLVDQERASLKSRFEKGDISQEGYNYAIRKPAHQTVKTDDGFYSKYIPDNIVDLFDFDTALSAYGSKFRETVKRNTSNYRRNPDGSIAVDLNGNPIGTNQLEERYKNADMLAEGLRETIKGDAAAYASAVQEAGYQGIDVDTFIDNKIDPILKRESGRTTADLGQLYKGTRPTGSSNTIVDMNMDRRFGTKAASNTMQLNRSQSKLSNRLRSKVSDKETMGSGMKEVGRGFLEIPESIAKGVSKLSDYYIKGDKDVYTNDKKQNSKYDNSGYYKPNESEIGIVNDILKAVGFNNEYKDLSVKEKGIAIPMVADYLDEHYIDEDIAASGTRVTNEDNDEFRRLFFNSKDGEIKRSESGNLIYSGEIGEYKVWNPDYGEMNGDELMTKLSNGDIDGIDKDDVVSIRLIRDHSYKNPATYFTGEDSFSLSSEVDFNGVNFFITNPLQDKGANRLLSKIFKLKRTPNQTLNIEELDTSIQYDKDSKKFIASFDNDVDITDASENKLLIKLIEYKTNN